MKDIFDKMYNPDEDYGERLAIELRKVAKAARIATRLFILGVLLLITSYSLIVSACIKYLFFH